MAYADTDRNILEALNTALVKWTEIQFKDRVNDAVGLKAHILDNDMPELRRVRWYAMHDQVHAEELWTRYIENAELEGELKESVFDFYISGATYIWLNTPTASTHYESFIQHLSSNISWMQNCRLVPDTVKQHAGTNEGVNAFLKGNHWAVFLFLLSMLDL